MIPVWHETYYLTNLFLTVAYTVIMFAYLSGFDLTNPKTRALRRLLIWSVSWAIYDLIMAQSSRTLAPETAFSLFRWLAFMWLGFPGAAGEMALSLIRPLKARDRLWLNALPLGFYLAAVIRPDLISAAVYGIPLGHPNFPGPWQQAFQVYWMGLMAFLLVYLGFGLRRMDDPLARKETILLASGILASTIGLGLSRWLLNSIEAEIPALGNLTILPFVLAAFWGLRRYGRVLSTRVLYKTIIEATPNGVVRLNGDRIVWANEGMARLTGLQAKDELEDVSLRGLVSPMGTGQESPGREEIERIVTGRARDLEIRLGEGGSLARPCLVNSALIRQGGREAGTVAVFTDLSDRLRAEQEREDRSRLQGAMEMAAAACHELNQPLQVLTGQVELLFMSLSRSEDISNRIDKIYGQIDRLTDMTRKIEGLTRYTTKGYAGEARIIDLDKSSL
jgi:PAS domain S-box-containing protein